MARALTARTVETMKPDAAKRLEVPDGALPGLYLVVQPSGAKSWALRYRFAGKSKKATIGKYPAFGLAEARDEARRSMREIEKGEDPVAKKRAAQEEPTDTVQAVVADFIKRHVSRNRSAADQEALLRLHVLPKWGHRPIESITRRDVIQLLDGIVDRGTGIMANRTRALLNTFFRWALSRDVIAVNPVEHVKPPAPENVRDRVLTDYEITVFWRATERMGHPFGPIYRLLLLTGQRLREVAEITEAEVCDGLWTLPAERAKNGIEHDVPLSPQAAEILDGVERFAAPELAPSARFVFTTTGRTPVSGFTRGKARLDREMLEIAREDAGDPAAEVPEFRIHDLRRTAATGMAELGFAPHVVEACLNHVSGSKRGVAGVYNRAKYLPDRRQALAAWANRIDALMRGDDDKIVPIRVAR